MATAAAIRMAAAVGGAVTLIKREAILVRLKAEGDSVLKRQIDLNREMMRLPMAKRRERWQEYYARLSELAKHRQQIEEFAATLPQD